MYPKTISIPPVKTFLIFKHPKILPEFFILKKCDLLVGFRIPKKKFEVKPPQSKCYRFLFMIYKKYLKDSGNGGRETTINKRRCENERKI
jgi:hypothetical protein